MRTNRIIIATIFMLSLALLLPAPAQAVIETFDSYPPHVNSSAVSPPGEGPGDTVYWIYGDAPTNEQIIASWSEDLGEGINPDLLVPMNSGLTSAGIASNGSDTYAFGAGSGDNPGQGAHLGIMDFGMQEWGMTSGIIADYLGPQGRDLHGGTMDVRALLAGFSAQIQLGFVSDMEIDFGGQDGMQLVEFHSPTFDVTDSFTWYHGNLDDFLSDFDDTMYGNLPGVKILGVWIDLINNTPLPAGALVTDGSIISGELQVDQINLVPEPATLTLLGLAGLALAAKRRN